MQRITIEPVITDAFSTTVLTLERAISRKRIIGVVSSRGVGFKFAARRFALKNYLGITYLNVEAAPSFSEVFGALDRSLCNIKFSDVDYKRTSIHTLTRKINEKIHLYDKCLLILDNCNLTPGQLKYFIRFLGNFNRSIGIVFRMNQGYFKELTGQAKKKKGESNNQGEGSKKWGDCYNKLLKVTDDWKEIPDPAKDEIEDICKVHGVNDPMIIDDLMAKSGHNLSQIKKNIDRYRELKTNKNDTPKETNKKGESQPANSPE